MALPKKKQRSGHAQFTPGSNTTVYPESLLSQLERHGHMRVEQIMRAAHLPPLMKRDVEKALEALSTAGKVQRARDGKWMHGNVLPTVTGILSIQRSGAAFVRPDAPEERNSPEAEPFDGAESGRPSAMPVDKLTAPERGSSTPDLSDEDSDSDSEDILGKRNISLASPAGKAKAKKNKSSVKNLARSRKAGNANDIFIHANWIGEAWNNDRVEVVLLPGNSGPRVEGRVLRVIDRKQTNISATLGTVYGNKSSVGRPTDPRLNFDLEIDISELTLRPKQGDLVLVETAARLSANPPRWAAKALRLLGRESDAKVQEELTKVNFNIPQEFPADVIKEAEHVAAHTPLDLEQRTDLRELGLVTIDGADARDFDDAIYVEELKEGTQTKKARWRMVVAIADVAHFVRPNSALDKEARERGNSCYFPCSVEPMLPQSLSNGVCSLKPNEDRAVLFADLLFNAAGEEVASRFGTGLMRSQARLTYEQAEKAMKQANQAASGPKAAPIANSEPATHSEPTASSAATSFAATSSAATSSAATSSAPAASATGSEGPWLTMLNQAAPLAALLIERRKQRGSLDFELPEASFITNAQGEVTGMVNLEHLFSHSLIEAFMVAANESVARHLTAKRAPFLYRVHPEPSLEKVENLLRSLKAADLLPQGMRWPGKKDSMAKFLPELLNSVRGTDQEFVVHRLILRTMMQARYSPEHEGHFGLASSCYCHFTSPIRRYADLVAHRTLRHSLGIDKGKLVEGQKLQDVADQCNTRERVAQEAEREITKRFGCLLLQDKVGSEFKGVINGVTSFGLFIELVDMPVEGMVRLEKLGDDYFEYDPDRQELLGRMTGRRFTLGQSMHVRLVEVNVSRLEINLELIHKVSSPNGQGRKNTGSNRPAKTVLKTAKTALKDQPKNAPKSSPKAQHKNPAKTGASHRKTRP